MTGPTKNNTIRHGIVGAVTVPPPKTEEFKHRAQFSLPFDWAGAVTGPTKNNAIRHGIVGAVTVPPPKTEDFKYRAQ
ncbi:MAG: hypothetical protein PVG78_08190, partial [Desulfobacterales bacterium]